MCRNLTRFFGAVRALHQVSLSINRGEIVCLVGDNGAGKSTLVKILSGTLAPDDGRIEIDGRDYRRYDMREAQRLGIQTVHQHLALCDKLSAAENIVLGREPGRFRFGPIEVFDRARAREIAEQSLKAVSATIPNIDLPVEKLSGGQRQAIAIARAVNAADRMVIFDEPTAALGIKQTAATLDAIRKVADTGLAALVIMHNLDDVYEIADRIIALRLGFVVADVPRSGMSRSELAARMSGHD
ncbi:ATP-binding cassette domain-containing protein [Roseisalinus antarcticus]|uniref:ATP-binding cassette domain-containing protein n=1 Tax=Roseisalinus antarcticus TaxID=254357 RepID=UPI0013565A32|nr:ATP-binding cassette domain-containing protein [Roseisalinus antarcticus]